ncbi:NAD(+) synthase [Hoeflea prorocentri]|uniref:NH(3)-dependent NAD(+) synthetase n=1 Tax=Hoeflea prorocentri TaxID=1922333 RepID=A0A9X3ZHV4_9HYPH|nr:NAD(+) synthase [Hoeflea prorocentri]MCY6381749.1 NAD(+) synthase [Hoeflea prorocentri]MDA5399549.1 NAD(+) synthase [Hoeflea prorocentri]
METLKVESGEQCAGAELSAASLELDAAAETDRIAEAIREQVLRRLRRRGAVVGLSGGIDSSVTAALCVRALGSKKVVAILMPEKDSDDESLTLGRLVAEELGIESVVEDIEPSLTAAGCYRRRDEFIRRLVPEFGPGWGCKIVLANALESKGINLSSLVVQSPDGEQQKLRMPLDVYQGVVAAANMKQRTRKQLEYYHADRLNYAVAGTPNLLELDQGFFVKNGDGAADFKPIAHLYKSQVYQLAEYLAIPETIRERPPTTDTWSLPQSQEEFYFALPYAKMDLCLFGLNNGVAKEEVAAAVGLSADQVEQVWRDIAAKRRVADYLHKPPLMVQTMPGSEQ